MNTDLNVWKKISITLSSLGILGMLASAGFSLPTRMLDALTISYVLALVAGGITTFVRYYYKNEGLGSRLVAIDLIAGLLLLRILYLLAFACGGTGAECLAAVLPWLQGSVVMALLREIIAFNLNLKRTVLNPAQFFILSFILIILLGALLLLLPKASYTGISFLDALFTSTSAVCVTGLIVVDTGSFFTPLGQYIIMALIQVGGIGILTFASYFSYFFKGGSSYESQLTLSDMTSTSKVGEVFTTLKNVIAITFLVELVSALLIYMSLDGRAFDSTYQRGFFAVFHSISAFCNAGFSTLPNSLYETGFRYNYNLHLVVIATFVLGGLGFPIVANLVNFLKYKLSRLLFTAQTKRIHRPWVLSLNSRITLITTTALTVVGFVLFFLAEYDNTLAEHSGYGKVVTALFGAASPRTAGFNSVDMASLHFSTVMIIFLLMWIGASPASTGGGIKTSTFAIATLNIISLARGKTRIEVFRREIADISVRRAFAVISLSLIVIGMGIVLISIFDSEKDLLSIGFECFSAYSTVGLSVGITAKLSSASKFVIILVMFVGRVSMLSVVIAVFKKVKHFNYRYPTEEITIN
jgi:Trk-type K+ transport system membrane component